MIQKSFFTILFIFGMVFSVSLYHSQSGIVKIMPNDQIVILNMDNSDELPRNFRITHALSQDKEKLPSDLGLAQLRASASGQFSQKSFVKILETIPAKKILLLDLREESHGFINGIAISWYEENNWSNKDKNLEEITRDENERLQKAIKDRYLQLTYKKNLEDLEPKIVYVYDAYTEADLAKKMGVDYVRLPVTDHLRPSDEEVDLFINLIKNFKSEYPECWIHFHCSAGRGRSTSFIAMYDMMNNAKNVTFEDILSRQALLGGKDLTQPFTPSDWRYLHHFGRLKFLTEFYNYCLENPNFEQSWSSWIHK